MFKKCIMAFGVLAVSGAALLLTPASIMAQHHGGGHGGGGGHAGSSFNGGTWSGHHGGSGFWWGLGTGYALGSLYGGGYYPYYGGYYSPYYYSPYYYSDVVPYPYYGGNVMYSTSAYAPAPSSDNRAHLTIRVPSDRADVWIEGQKTTQDRSTESYASPPLDPNKDYRYEVRARWTDPNGKAMDQTRTFPIHAGEGLMVDFSRPAPEGQR